MRKVIVFGGSAGGIQSLCNILSGLPARFQAAVLAVIHTSETSTHLPEVLGRCCHLRVVSPARPEPISGGNLYIAQPNRHLIVKSHCAVSWLGPRENRHRPAVDTLFRSAARVYRNQVIGVVLSGALDDGAAGAAAIKARGGTVIVEDPAQALVPDMPGNVVRQMEVDHCLPYAEIAGQLLKLVMNKRGQIKVTGSTRCESLTLDTGLEELEPPGFTCPDCGGVLTEVKSGRSVQLLCHVGHRFSLKTFSEAHADALERALWVALRRLNEQQSIQENLAEANRQNSALSKRYRENAVAAQHDKKLLHEILSRL